MKSSSLHPTKPDQKLASQFLSTIKEQQAVFRFNAKGQIRIRLEDNDKPLVISETVFELLLEILQCMAEGTAISIVKTATYISTQKAADLLGISRPSMVKLLENGDLPFKMAGTHRRISIGDLLHYQLKIKESVSANLNFIANPSQQIDLGYK